MCICISWRKTTFFTGECFMDSVYFSQKQRFEFKNVLMVDSHKNTAFGFSRRYLMNWSGVDCCDAFTSLILTAPIHCRASIGWASDVMLYFSKSDEKSVYPHPCCYKHVTFFSSVVHKGRTFVYFLWSNMDVKHHTGTDLELHLCVCTCSLTACGHFFSCLEESSVNMLFCPWTFEQISPSLSTCVWQNITRLKNTDCVCMRERLIRTSCISCCWNLGHLKYGMLDI